MCVSAAAPHPRVPSTTLSLVPGQPGIVATNATCFEAWFSLMGVPAGAFAASLRTAWGSVTLNISVLPPLLPAAPTLIDVDTAHGGDIAVALLAAAGAPAPRRVRLGARVYSLNNTLQVPNGTWQAVPKRHLTNYHSSCALEKKWTKTASNVPRLSQERISTFGFDVFTAQTTSATLSIT